MLRVEVVFLERELTHVIKQCIVYLYFITVYRLQKCICLNLSCDSVSTEILWIHVVAQYIRQKLEGLDIVRLDYHAYQKVHDVRLARQVYSGCSTDQRSHLSLVILDLLN